MKKPKIKKCRLLMPSYILYDLGRILGVIPGLIWLRPKWVYESKAAKKRIRGGAILMVNHIGFADPILAQFAVWYRRQHFVTAKELFAGKVKNVIFNIFRCIEIDRENFNFNSFRDILDHLKYGNVVTIYPEGHINTGDDGVAAFKSGVVMMALQSGAPVVPVYVSKAEGFWARPTFCIGEPINLAEKYGKMPSLETVEKISEQLRLAEIKLADCLSDGKERKK